MDLPSSSPTLCISIVVPEAPPIALLDLMLNLMFFTVPNDSMCILLHLMEPFDAYHPYAEAVRRMRNVRIHPQSLTNMEEAQMANVNYFRHRLTSYSHLLIMPFNGVLFRTLPLSHFAQFDVGLTPGTFHGAFCTREVLNEAHGKLGEIEAICKLLPVRRTCGIDGEHLSPCFFTHPHIFAVELPYTDIQSDLRRAARRPYLDLWKECLLWVGTKWNGSHHDSLFRPTVYNWAVPVWAHSHPEWHNVQQRQRECKWTDMVVKP